MKHQIRKLRQSPANCVPPFEIDRDALTLTVDALTTRREDIAIEDVLNFRNELEALGFETTFTITLTPDDRVTFNFGMGWTGEEPSPDQSVVEGLQREYFEQSLDGPWSFTIHLP